MVVRKRIVWDKEARDSFKKAYQWIKKDSIQNAEKARNYFLIATMMLSDGPEKHPPGKYRKDGDVRFRAFEKYSYRVSYFISEF